MPDHHDDTAASGFTDTLRGQLEEGPAATTGAQVGEREPGPVSEGPADPGAPRIAVYDHPATPPRVVAVAEPLPGLIDAVAIRVYDLASQQGGHIPFTALRELVENLIHAGFRDVVVTILDSGRTIRIADRGPGIPEKDRALRPGFTTAGADVKRYVRGVGSGLAVARESLAGLDGTLEVEDNLEGGTVVTARVPPLPGPMAAPAAPTTRTVLNDRQLRLLLVLLELGSAGPTRLARELGISSSTAYRELVRLGEDGLVGHDDEGRRFVTEQGLDHLEAVL